MHAIILAGGTGTRLKPYTTLIPKPLVPIGGEYSIIEIIILQLKRQGFNRVTVAVNHLAELIMAFLGDGSRWGMQIDYSIENKPLGTIGPLTKIASLPDHFLVMNGDILTDLDYGSFLKNHIKSGRPISVSAFSRDSRIDFGVLKYDQQGRLTEFKEKPVYHFDVSMGVNCFSRKIIEALPGEEKYGFDNLMLDGLKNGTPIHVQPFSGFWLDVGRPEDYDYINENYEVVKKKLEIGS